MVPLPVIKGRLCVVWFHRICVWALSFGAVLAIIYMLAMWSYVLYVSWVHVIIGIYVSCAHVIIGYWRSSLQRWHCTIGAAKPSTHATGDRHQPAFSSTFCFWSHIWSDIWDLIWYLIRYMIFYDIWPEWKSSLHMKGDYHPTIPIHWALPWLPPHV